MEDLVSTPMASEQVDTASQDTVELVVGEQVFGLLAESSFQAAWDTLYKGCPWGTAFQSRDFVATWYQIYNSQYQPVLVRRLAGSRLTGLLTLARDRSGLIVGAGASQAEYQVWLSDDSQGTDFIRSAFSQVSRHFPGQTIRLRYIPGNTPMIWLGQDKVWQQRCLLRACSQPLLRIDADKINLELKKKNRREKINRLKRLGELRFERVTDSQEFSAIFDELATQYDFRKGAMFNRLFFRDDPFRKKFLLSLFRQQMLHATILWINEDIIASNVGVMGKNWVHLQGINTHAPQYARYSPGILHFLMLGKLMAEEGMEVFDLTPGADAYKDALANDSGQAFELIITKPNKRQAGLLKNKLMASIKQSALKAGAGPDTLRKVKRQAELFRERLRMAGKQGWQYVLPALFFQVSSPKKIKVYQFEPTAGLSIASGTIATEEGNLPDLLAFDAGEGGATRWDFLAEAMRRLECGDQFFTWSEKGRLLGCAWLRGKGPSPGSEMPSTEWLAGAVVLEAFYCHPAAARRYPVFLQALALRLAHQRPEAKLFALNPAAQMAMGRYLKAAGFREAPQAQKEEE